MATAEQIKEDTLRRRAFGYYKRSGGHLSSGDIADKFRKYGVTALQIGKIKSQDKWAEKLKAEEPIVQQQPRRRVVKPKVEPPKVSEPEPKVRKPRTKKTTTPSIRQRDKFNRALKLFKDSGGTISKTTLSKKADVTMQTLATWMKHPDWLAQTKQPEMRTEPETSKPTETAASKPIRKREQFDRARQIYHASGKNISNTKIIKALHEEFGGTKVSPATLASWKAHAEWEESSPAPKHVEVEPKPVQLEFDVEAAKLKVVGPEPALLQLLQKIVDTNAVVAQQITELLKK